MYTCNDFLRFIDFKQCVVLFTLIHISLDLSHLFMSFKVYTFTEFKINLATCVVQLKESTLYT